MFISTLKNPLPELKLESNEIDGSAAGTAHSCLDGIIEGIFFLVIMRESMLERGSEGETNQL